MTEINAAAYTPNDNDPVHETREEEEARYKGYLEKARSHVWRSETDPEVMAWLAIRKEAAKHIDPETAEVWWCYAQTMDPYGVEHSIPEGFEQVGREYFARAPGSDVWVCFRDLPDATADDLWKKHRSKLAFPASLEDILQRSDPPQQAGNLSQQ